MIKKRIVLYTVLVSAFVGIASVEAYTFGVSYASTGGSSTPTEEPEPKSANLNDEGTLVCRYKYNVTTGNVITINGYDLLNNPIMEHSLKISDHNRLLAGTSIGLNIYETKTVGWEVTEYYIEESKSISKATQYICKYSYHDPNSDYNSDDYEEIEDTYSMNGASESDVRNNKHNYCTANHSPWELYGVSFVYGATEYVTDKVDNPDQNDLNKCLKIAREDAIAAANYSLYPTYKIELSDSNDINGTEVLTITNDDAYKNRQFYDKNGNKLNCSNCQFSSPDDSTTKSDSMKIRFDYKPKNVCMDARTSKVYYRKTECNTGELKIENDTSSKHWHYFLPLNAKTTDNLEINLMYGGTGANLNENECLYVMQNNAILYKWQAQDNEWIQEDTTTYVDLIKPMTEGDVFTGDYTCKFDNSQNKYVCATEERSTDLKEIKNGCRLTSIVKIPIKQEFYNEVTSDGKTTLRGFNFYYKPIDVNNPFPNVVLENSLWNNWNKSTTKNPNLSKSFEDVTYIATDINSNEVRKYNKDNPYTSWSNMNLDGTSKYIDNEEIIKRGNDISVYKLGCGPANSKEYLDEAKKIKNTLFIKGCENKS